MKLIGKEEISGSRLRNSISPPKRGGKFYNLSAVLRCTNATIGRGWTYYFFRRCGTKIKATI
jgi:hypothetical protein